MMDDFILISTETPLISNLNMNENIALIKEVHKHLQIKEAEDIATKYLNKINLSKIGLLRLSQCKPIEIFYVMYIRALMMPEKNLVIVSPFNIIRNVKNMQDVIENLAILNDDKNILIIDTITNESRYKGVRCNMIK